MKNRLKKQNDRLFNVLWRQTLLVMVMVSLAKMGATLVDGVIMGRAYGAASAAAMGLALPFSTLTSLLGGLISTGCQTVCAAAHARGDVKASNRAFVTSFYIAVSVSALITAGVFLFAGPIGWFFGARGDNAYLLPETAAYLRGLSVGAAAMVLNLILAPMVQLYTGGKWANRAILLLFVSDVLFDVLSVILGLGSWGIGLATALSNTLCVLVMLFCLVSGKTGLNLSLKHFDPSSISGVLRQGLPEAAKRLFRMAAEIAANIIVLSTAAGAAMAGKTVGNMLACLLTTLGSGAASAMYLLSGAYIAMEDAEGLFAIGKKQALHLLITLVLTVLSIVFTPQLTDLMLTADAETKRTAVICVRCILVQMPFYVCSEMVTSYLQSIGLRKLSGVMSLFGQTLLYLPLLAVMGMKFGAVGVLLSQTAALMLTLAIFYVRRCVKLRRVAGLSDIMHLSECVRTDQIDVVTRRTVQDTRDAVDCSEEIRTGLLRLGADPKTAAAASLFVEEICADIIGNGFKKSEPKRTRLFPRKRYISVFAFVQADVITLRIYDNCILYDPMEKRESLEKLEEQPERGLGPKLVLLTADEASYTSMLNMNHMLIRIPMHRSGAAEAESKKRLQCFDERYIGWGSAYSWVDRRAM